MQILLTEESAMLALRGGAWQVLWVTLRLSRFASRERCDALEMGSGTLSMGEISRLRTHLSEVVSPAIQGGEYLLRDLTLTDLHPREAFPREDLRREIYLDHDSLKVLIDFLSHCKREVAVRRVNWRQQKREARGEKRARQGGVAHAYTESQS